MMKAILTALTMLAWAIPAHATCDLQNQLNQGGTVRVPGTCNISSTLTIGQPMTELVGPGRIVSSASPALRITTANTYVGSLVIEGPGTGIELDGALRAFLRDLQINTLSGDGLVLKSGAGLWSRGLHFNGGPNSATFAVRALEWDTAFFTDLVSEEHYGGFRLGSDKIVGNFYFSNVVLDRIGVVGVLAEPWSGGRVDNMQFSNLWMAGSLYPIILNATDGGIANTQIVNGRFTGFQYQLLEFGGPLRTQTVNMIYD